MALAASTGYTVDDFLWLRNRLGVYHLELDPWGSLIVTPASDEHEIACSHLMWQAMEHMGPPENVLAGFSWKVPGGSGYTNVPDLTVLAPGWCRLDDEDVEPAPLVVVEVASPSTVKVDRTRKLDDYRLGRAGLYVRVDFFGPGKAGFEVYDLVTGSISIGTGTADLVVDGRPLRFDLRDLPK